MEMKYRFDDAYEKIYRYDVESRSYIFHGSYLAYGISAGMGYGEQFDKVELQDLMSIKEGVLR